MAEFDLVRVYSAKGAGFKLKESDAREFLAANPDSYRREDRPSQEDVPTVQEIAAGGHEPKADDKPAAKK